MKNDEIVLGFKIAKKATNLSKYLEKIRNMEKNGGLAISRFKEIKIDGFDAIQQLEDVRISDPGCYWKTYINKGDRYDEVSLMSATCTDTLMNLEGDYNMMLFALKYTK